MVFGEMPVGAPIGSLAFDTANGKLWVLGAAPWGWMMVGPEDPDPVPAGGSSAG
jgi:hypothetical protein